MDTFTLGEGESWRPTTRLSRLRFGSMLHPDAKAKIALDVNGDPVEVAFAPHKTLLEVLREDLSLTGTKHGCELGECGTCTVLVDDTPVLSCLVLGLACAGRRVRTVEGMASGGKLHPLQDAFAELGAAQCGYCTPGTPAPPGRTSSTRWRATSAAARATSRSTRPLSWRRPACAASGPSRHRRACMASAKRALRVVGKPLRKVDATAKVTGTTRFADDLFLPRMLYAKLLRSPHAHARIVAIDSSPAAGLVGVKGVLTGKDLPIAFGILPVSQDEHALALDKVRFVGDPVAAVAATTEEAAAAALAGIAVRYEPLRPVTDAEDARAHP